MAYIELADLRAYLGPDGTGDDILLTTAAENATKYIESQTNRVFEGSTTAETHYYSDAALDADDSTLLHLDADLLSVTTLTNGDSAGTTIVPANYWLLNRNLGPPYHWIKLKTDVADYWQWDIDCWVSVLGTWGYSETPPADIRQATLAMAAYLYRKKDAQVFDVTAVTESGALLIPQGIPATVTAIIERYKRYL